MGCRPGLSRSCFRRLSPLSHGPVQPWTRPKSDMDPNAGNQRRRRRGPSKRQVEQPQWHLSWGIRLGQVQLPQLSIWGFGSSDEEDEEDEDEETQAKDMVTRKALSVGGGTRCQFGPIPSARSNSSFRFPFFFPPQIASSPPKLPTNAGDHTARTQPSSSLVDITAVLSAPEAAHMLQDVEGPVEVLAPTPSSPGQRSRDCLLYTSPSPRDRTRSRMPSSA